MPLKNKPAGQFKVLTTSAIDITHESLKHHRQNIIVAHNYDDFSRLITTTQFDLVLLDLSETDVPDQLRHSHHPWQSVAQVPDQLRHSHHPWQSDLIARIKDPLGINNQTPIIAIINSSQDAQTEAQSPMEFDDSLIGPLTAERLNEIIDCWETKALALSYIKIILSKTKNNQRLTLTLFEKLFEELPRQIIDIKDALENKQYDLAQAITHKLNGSASFCGLTDIQQPAEALESSLLKKHYADTHQQFLMLRQHGLNFTRLQESILKSLGEC